MASFTEPNKEKEAEVTEGQSDSDDEVPNLEEVGEDGKKGDDEGGKFSRGEKKARKALQKIGMRPIPGVLKVSLKKSKNMMFVINSPDVFKSAVSDTYVIFGEAKVEDLSQNASSQAAEQFRAPLEAKKPAVIPTPMSAPVNKSTVIDEGGDVDESGVDSKDIDLVIEQTGVSRSQAVKALKNNGNDLVNAIMELTM
mmetsp:Transcript_27895/g.28176  ORF Transcript_27895/g.28176 Transcript_27895/m.28176 type:complete len:197 (+) Transcript_27895:162-752(+)|eukprot:CAMPEP_0182416814 /NCGR_PEP_ID=MMETSP1167-20130531/1180_1 /TAXON_ID=2988 /ORGANISM="Mallomonas Sp, Strain CCMP3275" /LENGTH=196 /DNA_ID=CAMNT_0024589905 /DNA_START=149 /DNA_END=739 /DNA_ORIENTATION=+